MNSFLKVHDGAKKDLPTTYIIDYCDLCEVWPDSEHPLRDFVALLARISYEEKNISIREFCQKNYKSIVADRSGWTKRWFWARKDKSYINDPPEVVLAYGLSHILIFAPRPVFILPEK